MLIAANAVLGGRRWLRFGGLTLLVILLLLIVASFALHQFLVMVGRTAEAVTQVDIAGRQVAMWSLPGPPRQMATP